MAVFHIHEINPRNETIPKVITQFLENSHDARRYFESYK